MTHEAFAGRIVAIQERLYRISASLLRQDADREDAVQSCIEKAWRKRALLRDEDRFEAWVTRILINEWESICQGAFYLSPKHSTIWYSARRRSNPLKQSICINIRANDDVGAWTTFS